MHLPHHCYWRAPNQIGMCLKDCCRKIATRPDGQALAIRRAERNLSSIPYLTLNRTTLNAIMSVFLHLIQCDATYPTEHHESGAVGHLSRTTLHYLNRFDLEVEHRHDPRFSLETGGHDGERSALIIL